MCLNILTGELAVTAKRSLVVLQAVKLTLDNSDTNFTSLGCPSNSCPNNLQAADYVRLGASLKASFGSSYTCGTAECIGACVTSSQVRVQMFWLLQGVSIFASFSSNVWYLPKTIAMYCMGPPCSLKKAVYGTTYVARISATRCEILYRCFFWTHCRLMTLQIMCAFIIRRFIFQYINDIFSPSLNSSIMSSVLDIKLWDPENSLSLNVTEIPSGMEVKMVATKSTNQSYNVSGLL